MDATTERALPSTTLYSCNIYRYDKYNEKMKRKTENTLAVYSVYMNK